jgi:hypothetical protein
MQKRGRSSTPTDTLIESLDEPIALLAQELRRVIRRALPDAAEGIKWGMPVYEQNGLVCAIRPARDYVALQFYTAGTSLRDPHGLLEGSGKKMRHVKIRTIADIRPRVFGSWLKQAAMQK